MNIVIFGGTGFIGIHYARALIRQDARVKVHLADMRPIDRKYLFDDVRIATEQGRLEYKSCDVKNYDSFGDLPKEDVHMVANFAAVHREPGHTHAEYFSTNILGAENVCEYCRETNCPILVFTSSIAVYEPSDSPKSERNVPAPTTSYGGSKLAAELIHQRWQCERPRRRKLVVLRPGVVYGPSEGGNVTRMIKAIKRGYFVFVGDRRTRKSSIYVKELIGIINHYVFKVKGNFILSNAVVPVSPTVEDYVRIVKGVTGWKRFVPSVPYFAVLLVSHVVSFVARLFGKDVSMSPARVSKLRKINNIVSDTLGATNYEYQYTTESSFADWYHEWPMDW